MQYIRSTIIQQKTVYGTWCNLGSSISSEIIACCGYDWILLDSEHTPATTTSLLYQLQAVSAFPIAPLVRIPSVDRVYCKWALDMGAAGIMFPCVECAGQAREAVSFMRYEPQGRRGVGPCTRASMYGRDFATYYEKSNDNLLTVVQIESRKAVQQCEEIAAVEGVDVLFIGPADLSASMGLPDRFADKTFMDTLAHVADAARKHHKASGILLPSPSLVPTCRDMGYTFIAVGSDTAILRQQLTQNLKEMQA